MNLTTELIKNLLPEDEKKKVVAVYGGGFKPPTKGHFTVVKQAIKENPEIDEFIILVGGKDRDGVTQADSIMVWDIYKQYLPIMVTVRSTSVPPIKGIYDYAKEHPNEEVLFIIGAREGNEEDFADIANRTKSLDNYSNLELRTIVTQGGVSGTAARNAAKISVEKLSPFLPDELTDEEEIEVYNIISPNLREGASYSQDIDIKQKIKDLTQHMLDKGMNIRPLPKVIFKHNDVPNAKEFMGTTAYYDPNTMTIVLYTEGRHPKDIVRSFSHEMVHHTQNIEDRLGDIQTTNTQEDDHLDKIEQEANLIGTMTFRNWTDSLNESIKKINYTNPNFKEEWNEANRYSEFEDMGKQGWIDIANKGYVTSYSKIKNNLGNVDLDFDGLEKPKKQRFQDALDKGTVEMSIAVKFADDDYDLVAGNTRISGLVKNQIDPKIWIVDLSNNINEAIVGDKVVCDNCGWSWDISSGGKDPYLCHKCGYDNTPINEDNESYKHKHGFNDKLGKDPFGINAFARELAMGLEENEELKYQIYCDLDGVLADFELGYEKLTGMDLKGEFFSGEDFWKPISKAGVGFWVGLQWMPDGQRLWDYIKPFDPIILSAPSRDKSSRLGKALWVRNKIPGTKLLLRYAKLKQQLATPTSILIDDRADNINQWEAAGGIGILHTSASNTIEQLKKLKL